MCKIQKVYKPLTKSQKERGIIFSSTLSCGTTETPNDPTQEVHKDNPNKSAIIRYLSNEIFFHYIPWQYNIIRQ